MFSRAFKRYASLSLQMRYVLKHVWCSSKVRKCSSHSEFILKTDTYAKQFGKFGTYNHYARNHV